MEADSLHQFISLEMNEKEGIPKLNWMLYFYSMSKILDWNSTPTNLWLTILKFYTKKMVAHTPGAHQHEGQSDHDIFELSHDN